MDELIIEGIEGQCKTFRSLVNGGRTVILPSAAAAIAVSQQWADDRAAEAQKLVAEKAKVTVTYKSREGKTRTKKMSAGAYWESEKNNRENHATACEQIVSGVAEIKDRIKDTAAKLMDTVLEIDPSLNTGYMGFDRWEDGEEVLLEALQEGDDRPFLRRKHAEFEPKIGKGDGAYRIIISTDVQWGGIPSDNGGVMGALVMLLQAYGPVEIWIQQGWLGNGSEDGVTLFKLDFAGGFDPSALSFWIGSPFKDSPFSYGVSRKLGREGMLVARKAEMPCDLFLDGCWSKTLGFHEHEFIGATPAERHKMMASWLSTAVRCIAFEGQALEVAA